MVLSSPILLLLAVSEFSFFPIALAIECPTLLWSDEFDGSSLDLTKWEPQIGDGCAEGICGWGNNEWQHYKAENAVVEGGKLFIVAKKEGIESTDYTSARLRTKGLGGEFLQGWFEAKVKIPTGRGLNAAFWMLPSNEVLGGWPASGEIDIMENIGREQSMIHGLIHFGEPYPNNRVSADFFVLPGGQAFHADFHEFAIGKKEGEIRWYVDGYEYSVKTASHVAPSAWPFDQAGELFHFILNVAVGGDWAGYPDASAVFPQTMEVDYVRAYNVTTGKIMGPTLVYENQQYVTYTVEEGVADFSYAWSVPPDASIVADDGQGTVVVDFGVIPGLVQATATSAGCGISKVFTVPVELAHPPLSYMSTGHFVAPDSTPGGESASLESSSGTYDASAVDPLGNKRKVVQYTRSVNAQYDVIRYNVDSNLIAPTIYVDGTEKIIMDVYAPGVPPCTEILVQLEKASASVQPYPIGRHSRFKARLDGSSGWRRLTFDYVDRPDPSIVGVDSVVLMFDPNNFRGDVYYFKNFDSALVSPLSMYPNSLGGLLVSPMCSLLE